MYALAAQVSADAVDIVARSMIDPTERAQDARAGLSLEFAPQLE